MDEMEVLVRSIGAQRVLFGTDVHYILGKVYGAKLSEAERQRILCGNARALFRTWM